MILTVNAGSSSLKVALYERGGGEPVRVASAMVARIGHEAVLSIAGEGTEKSSRPVEAADHTEALARLVEALAPYQGEAPLSVVGHRIVHGGTTLHEPRVLDAGLLAELAKLERLAPLHQPINLACVRAVEALVPGAVQVGCFDTGFHHTMPWAQTAFALPPRYYDEGLRRYGFHGLSYTSVSRSLEKSHPALHAGRVVVAHLGNGASACAMKSGLGQATTMGFSTLDGLAMGTRCGQIDPGALIHLQRAYGMGLEELERLLYHDSGLIALSGVGADMRDIEAAGTEASERAIDYFVARAVREIGGLVAVLGGLDALVFCGGIGENSARVRAEIVAGLGFLGLELDPVANDRNAGTISRGPTPALVIPTDEEAVIAEACARLTA
ncbi:acetate/propionate family kinase [Amorphus coralli]|uniref:acetate/propionate family kinase n=1 Tax=Amorphus coralli TaxID=340680 RepID=UPI000360E4CD|nr:acetate/propionate family kinase [Amorphus coralli]